MSHIILLLLCGIMAVFQVTIFIIAITLYQLITKSCCGKGQNDAHVSILLISTIGLNIVLLIILVPLGVNFKWSLYIRISSMILSL